MKVVDRMLEWENGGSLKLLKQGYSLNPPELLFRKIEDEEIAAQIDKLHKHQIVPITASQNDVNKPSADLPTLTEAKDLPTIKPSIAFEDFDKIDLRVGTIIAAEKVEKADKLLKLTIDLGMEQRTVVSGIAMHYTPEEVVGLQVTLVANLAPRKMRGIESNGMILMAENKEGKLVFINPLAEAMNGCAVK